MDKSGCFRQDKPHAIQPNPHSLLGQWCFKTKAWKANPF